eukprot:scaffold24964_cov27-Tisochrysis_lutea.AAC.1
MNKGWVAFLVCGAMLNETPPDVATCCHKNLRQDIKARSIQSPSSRLSLPWGAAGAPPGGGEG